MNLKKHVIAITAGKGGVGKSNIALNLSASLAKLNKKVYLLDADFGLSNIDVLLGIQSKFTIEDVLKDHCSLKEILVKGPFGINIISGTSGISALAQMDPVVYSGIIQAFDTLEEDLDILIIDTPPGIGEPVIRFSIAAQDIIIVLSDEPTSLKDAYSLISLLHKNHQIYRFKMIMNRVNHQDEAESLFNKVVNSLENFPGMILQCLGWIPFDECLKKSVNKQRSVVEAYPNSPVAKAFDKLATDLLSIKSDPVDNGQAQFFLNHLLHLES